MASISHFPIHIKQNSEISVTIDKETNDLDLKSKDFYMGFIKVDGHSLYEKEYSLKSVIEHEQNALSVKLKFNIPVGIYLIKGYSYRMTDDDFINYSFLPEDMNVIQIYGQKEEYSMELKHIKNIALRDYYLKVETGIGKKIEGSKTYTSHIFIINAYIGKGIDLGTSKLTPIKRLDNRFIEEYMSEVLVSLGITEIIKPSLKKKSFDDPYAQPGVLLTIENVYAESIKQASDIHMKYAEDIVKVLALMNNSHGEIIGDVIVDNEDKKIYHRTIVYSYLGNMFVGFEDPHQFSNMKKMMENDLNNYYASLYLDAMRERSIDIKRLKLWTILESIAKNKDYANSFETLFSGEKIIKKNKPSKINNKSLSNVRELLRVYFDKTGQTPICTEDQLKIWYQERNCTAHKGRCMYEDDGYCTKMDYSILCRNYESSIRTNGIRNIDTLGFTLKNLVRDIIKFEINGGI